MSEPGGGGRQPDLLASLPAERPSPDPAALEGLRSGLAELRDEVAGLRGALEAEGPAPATAGALDAWGERVAGRVEAAARPDGGDAVKAAADRIEAALARVSERLSAEIGVLDRRLGESRPDGGGVSADDLDEAVEKMTARTRLDYSLLDTKLGMVRRDVSGLRFRWRAFLAPWAAFVFVLGMVLESHIHLLYRWLWVE